MSRGHTFKPGAAYRNGKLYEFTGDCVIVMRGWPEMRAWQWTGIFARPWRCVRPRLHRVSLREIGRMENPYLQPPEPNGQMLFPFAYSHTGACAYRAFWWGVPKAYREWVMPFRDRRWHMLALLARCPGADDLIVSNPALAFCLASNWAFHKPAVCQPLRAARSLVCKKQRRILEWLGFPGTESARQILRRIPPRSMTVQFLINLRAALRSTEWIRPLRFMNRITEDVFSIITTPERSSAVAFSFLEELAQEPYPNMYSGMAARIDDIRRMGEMLGRKIPRLRTMAQMNEVHDELVSALNLRQEAGRRFFPDPPVPGRSGEIEPLTTCQDLAVEGREQRHCVASYTEAVRGGHVYVYRMLKPERATLSIVPAHGGWVLGEIRGCHNARVQPDTCQAVRNWLNARPIANRPEPSSAKPGLFT